VPEKGDQGQSSANMVQKFPRGKNKGNNKPKKTTTFKKKKNKALEKCYACGKLGHFSKKANESKDVNMVTMGNTGDGYGNLPIVLSVFQSMSWCLDTGANVHVCADISMFYSYRPSGTSLC